MSVLLAVIARGTIAEVKRDVGSEDNTPCPRKNERLFWSLRPPFRGSSLFPSRTFRSASPSRCL